MRRIRSSAAILTAVVPESTAQYISYTGYGYLLFSFVMHVLFFAYREGTAFKALAVPTLVLFVFDFRRASHLGIRPSSLLAFSLLLHSTGDVLIKLVGVVPSMPAFLVGHIVYIVCFLRGCQVVSLRQLASFSPLKKLICLAGIGYGFIMWLLLYPHFDGVLRPVLACYITALSLQFVAANFSHSTLIPIGSALYVISDSFIGLAAFVYPNNSFVLLLDFYAWPLYYVGQVCITLGVLQQEVELALRPHPRHGYASYMDLLVLLITLATSYFSVRRILRYM